MKSKKGNSFIVIFTIMVIFTTMVIFPTVKGASESQTISITDTQDDGFVTEVGNRFWTTNLINVLDPNMDIRAYLVFRDIKINYWEPLNNATLRVRTANPFAFDPDSTFTIYGVKQKRFEGFGTGADVLSAPLTTASVNFNASEFYGAQFWDFNVTEIVAELISNPYWDGDGSASTDTGDNMGFVILGAEGFNTRHFYDLSAGNGDEADLIIGWNQLPPPPFDDAEYVGEHRGYEIWNFTAVNPWLNFSTFTVTGANSAIVSGLNDTYFHVTQLRGSSEIWMQRSHDDDGTGIRWLKFGIEFQDLQASGGGYDWYGIWGLSDTSNTWVDSWGEGYAFAGRTFDEVDDIHRGTAWDIEAGALGDSGVWFYSTEFLDSSMPYTLWFNITLNMNGAFYNVSTFNDMEMIDLNCTYNYAFDDLPPTYSPGAFPYETLVNGWNPLVATHGYTGNYRSGFIELAPETEWFIIPPNATLPPEPIGDCNGDGVIDEEDAECVIELLLDDPEDPNPGGSWPDEGPFTRFGTRLYIFILGVGLFWGPLFYFGARKPDGYQIVIGLFIMLIGVSLLIEAGSV